MTKQELFRKKNIAVKLLYSIWVLVIILTSLYRVTYFISFVDAYNSFSTFYRTSPMLFSFIFYLASWAFAAYCSRNKIAAGVLLANCIWYMTCELFIWINNCILFGIRDSFYYVMGIIQMIGVLANATVVIIFYRNILQDIFWRKSEEGKMEKERKRTLLREEVYRKMQAEYKK